MRRWQSSNEKVVEEARPQFAAALKQMNAELQKLVQMGENSQGTVRAAVKRAQAETYLLISLAAFAGSVIVTRQFLSMTGYPQIGNSVLHIAHALWGALLLLVAVLLPLLLSLTGVVLLSFYLDQFRAVVTALFQFGVLLLVMAYRRWYLKEVSS